MQHHRRHQVTCVTSRRSLHRCCWFQITSLILSLHAKLTHNIGHRYGGVRTILGTLLDFTLSRVQSDEPRESPLKGATYALGAICHPTCSLAIGVRSLPRRGRIHSSSSHHRG